MTTARPLYGYVLCALLFVACDCDDDDHGTDAGLDSGADSGVDSGPGDSGVDSSVVDSGFDSGAGDAGIDAATSMDAGLDAAQMDASRDEDAAPEPMIDAGITDIPFAGKVDFLVGSPYAGTIVAPDINGDGKPDLVTASAFIGVAVLLNTTADNATTPSFTTYTIFPLEDAITADIATADFNGDGRPDLVVPGCAHRGFGWTGEVVAVFLNTTATGASTPTFDAPIKLTAVDAFPYSIAATDINTDGKPDVVAASGSNAVVSVFLNTSTGTSTATFGTRRDVTLSAIATYGRSMTVGDLNADNRPDLVLNTNAWVASVLLNSTGTGATTASFATPVDVPLRQYTGGGGVAIADVTGDDKPDLVIGDNGDYHLIVVPNTTANAATTATFGERVEFPVPGRPSGVQAHDLDDDDRADIFAFGTPAPGGSGQPGAVWLLSNVTPANEPPLFQAYQALEACTQPGAGRAVDLNADGKPDVVAACAPSSGNGTLSVFLHL